VNARISQIEAMETHRATPRDACSDFEALFHAHHERISRVITRVIRDPGRAEEIAVEVFWKLWRNPRAQSENPGGWLYRAAVRLSLNELRRHGRAARNESLSAVDSEPPDPEQVRAATEEQEHVRTVLAAIQSRQAELLLLRATGLSYEEVASALELNPASIGTLISRAQQAFRKEYVKRYGEQSNERRALGG
jgi:RNA polymerase sigma-70 factor (ECF subfamily)